MGLLYWNSLLAVTALVFHCIPFAAFEFIHDGGATGRTFFPFAPLGLILMMTVCFPSLVVQSILLAIAFRKQSPLRYHRLYAIAISVAAIATMVILGEFGWGIHV